MIKHMVMFKLKEKNQASIDKATNAMQSLVGNIDTLRFLEVGVDFKNSDRSYDLVLTTHFDDKEDFKIYEAHPFHQPVIATMVSLCTTSIAVDYEI
jgi:hypothetical protein